MLVLEAERPVVEYMNLTSSTSLTVQKAQSWPEAWLQFADDMMNMIFRSHKFVICCYIDDIVIFSKILKNHLKHLNTVFNLFDKMRITFKEVKTYLDYSSIILLNQQVDDFDMTSSKKQIAALWDLSFLKTLKDLKIYLNLTDWLQ